MKKIFLFSLVAIVFLLAGCNRTKECRCTSVQKWDDAGIEPITGYSTIKLYDGNCSDKNTTKRLTDNFGPYTITISCVEI